MKKIGQKSLEKNTIKKGKFGKSACRNIEDIMQMLKMFRFQRLEGSMFNEDYTELHLYFESFTFSIDLRGAKWEKIIDLRVFPSPVIGIEPWEQGEDFNRTFKKYKKGTDYD